MANDLSRCTLSCDTQQLRVKELAISIIDLMKENQKILEKYIKKTALVANYRYSVLSRVKLCNTQFSPNLN